MNKLSSFIPLSLLAAAGFSFAQSSPSDQPVEQGHNAAPSIREAVTESSGGSVGGGNRASGAPATTEGNKALGTTTRGDPGSASTSDRDTSRTWSGVGSTGGGTGTGTSSGTTDDPPTSGGGQGGTSASGNATGGNPAPDSTANTGQSQPTGGPSPDISPNRP